MKTKFFCIAVEGATVDGRTIERNWLEEMAAGYNPATYTARINCEHIGGFSPEPPFNAYGSVLSLKTQEITLELAGKPTKKLGLFAELDANDQLVATVRKGQKLFTSCEIAINFANTGKAGLVGLAITDNPASLGTEMLEFAAKAAVNPLAHRKQDPNNHFSAAQEATIELEGAAADAPPSWLSALTGALEGIAKKFTGEPDTAAPAPPPPPPPAPANDNVEMAKLASDIGAAVGTAISAYAASNDAAVGKISADLAALTSRLEQTDGGPNKRQLSTGGSGREQAAF